MGLVVAERQMVDAQGVSDAFVGRHLCVADLEHRDTGLSVAPDSSLCRKTCRTQVNGCVQRWLSEILKPVDGEVILTTSWHEGCGQRVCPRSTVDGLQYREMWSLSGSGTSII